MTTNRNPGTPENGASSSPVDNRLGGEELEALGHGIYTLNATYIDAFTRLTQAAQYVIDNPELMPSFSSALNDPSSGMSYDVPISSDSLSDYMAMWSTYINETSIEQLVADMDWAAYIARYVEMDAAFGQMRQIMVSWKAIAPFIHTLAQIEVTVQEHKYAAQRKIEASPYGSYLSCVASRDQQRTA